MQSAQYKPLHTVVSTSDTWGLHLSAWVIRGRYMPLMVRTRPCRKPFQSQQLALGPSGDIREQRGFQRGSECNSYRKLLQSLTLAGVYGANVEIVQGVQM